MQLYYCPTWYHLQGLHVCVASVSFPAVTICALRRVWRVSVFSLRCSGLPFPFSGKDPWGRLQARASHPSHATVTARALLQKRCGQKPDSEDWHLAGVLGTGQQPQYTDGAWVPNPASLCWNWGY